MQAARAAAELADPNAAEDRAGPPGGDIAEEPAAAGEAAGAGDKDEADEDEVIMLQVRAPPLTLFMAFWETRLTCLPVVPDRLFSAAAALSWPFSAEECSKGEGRL